jgi:hypothetical protein
MSLIDLIEFILDITESETKKITFIFLDIIFAFCTALKIIFIKGLMEKKFISPYNISFIFAILNFIVITLLYFIVSFIPCEKDYCKTIYNGKSYLANLHEIFSITGIFLFFLFLIRAFLLVINYVIIHYFSVCHSFLYFFLCAIASILTDINYENDAFDSYSFIKMFLNIIGFIFVLIFLEIIEINICGISYNTKRNIENRSETEIEFIDIIKNDEDTPAEEEIEKEEEDREEVVSEAKN